MAGRYDAAIEDYDLALRIGPKLASSLYGRGMARRGKGQMVAAEIDISAAVALQLAPHFVAEEISLASIAETRKAYEDVDLRTKLARWHQDVDNAFYGWNDVWLDPEFRNWDISEYLAYVRVPLAIVQGTADQYGTIRQVEIAREECARERSG